MFKRLSRVLVATVAIGLLSTAIAQNAPTAPAAAAPAVDVNAILKEQIPPLFAARDQGNNAKKAIELLEQAKAADAKNYEVRWRLAQFHYFIADSTNDNVLKAKEGKLGWDEAEVAKKLNPSGVDGYYWTAACVGVYSEGSGIMTAVRQGLSDVFKQNAEKAEKINPNHDKGGPLRALGRFYFKLPWPLQDLEKSRSYLERAVKVSSESGRNLFYLADLEASEGNTVKAKELYNQVLALDPSKGDAPDIRLQQKRARAALAAL